MKTLFKQLILDIIGIPFRRFCLWLVVDSPIRLGRLAPIVFGWGIGSEPIKISRPEDKT